MRSKLIGYIIALAGLVILALPMLNIISIPGIKPVYVSLIGVAIVIFGVFLTFGKNSSSNVEQAEEEVPIYHGEGKKRKIVGYKRRK